jgi:hypothetical protein
MDFQNAPRDVYVGEREEVMVCLLLDSLVFLPGLIKDRVRVVLYRRGSHHLGRTSVIEAAKQVISVNTELFNAFPSINGCSTLLMRPSTSCPRPGMR